MSKTLAEHAAYELTRLGLVDHEEEEARKVARDTMALVRRFEKQGHTANSGQYVLQFFEDICNMIPLSPLTDDPAEWEEFEMTKENKETKEKITEARWTSKRSPRIMSSDGGKTWVDMPTGKTGESVDHKKQAENRKKNEEAIAKRKAEADSALVENADQAPKKTKAKKVEEEKTDGKTEPQAKS